MKRHITWKEQADELLRGNWGSEGESVSDRIKISSDQRLSLALLIDIAESLRALRCANFTGMPHHLRRTARAVEGLRRDLKATRRSRGVKR